MPRLISMAKTWPAILNQTKLVTRRDGWWDFANDLPRLRDGEEFEATEWSLRVGLRHICETCRWFGGKSAPSMCSGGWWRCQSKPCAAWRVTFRPPQRGIFLRHVSSRRELLTGNVITPEEVALEGFPGKTPDWFVNRAFPNKPPGFRVTRIRFEYV